MAEASTSEEPSPKIQKKENVDENERKKATIETDEKYLKVSGSNNGCQFSDEVANHYNELQCVKLDVRKENTIFYMRNFNNWIKGILIGTYLRKVRRGANALDLCCGKGGDMLKWRKGNIRHLICADIAWKSVEECESRYNNMCRRSQHIFTCEFITADCTRECLREKYKNPDIELDLVSCQFSFHYCFESLPQAERMLQNATECLKVGGYFIGTIPCADEIVKRIKLSNSKTIKNRIFSIEMCCDEPYPIFGAKYDFHLDSAVDCPEFLVHFPTFVRLAEKYGLSLHFRSSFADFYNRNNSWGQGLLKKMLALEPYSLTDSEKKIPDEYRVAEKYCKTRGYSGTVGTISQSEWDAVLLYQVFAFKKVRNYEGSH